MKQKMLFKEQLIFYSLYTYVSYLSHNFCLPLHSLTHVSPQLLIDSLHRNSLAAVHLENAYLRFFAPTLRLQPHAAQFHFILVHRQRYTSSPSGHLFISFDTLHQPRDIPFLFLHSHALYECCFLFCAGIPL